MSGCRFEKEKPGDSKLKVAETIGKSESACLSLEDYFDRYLREEPPCCLNLRWGTRKQTVNGTPGPDGYLYGSHEEC